ncbi:DUF1826 domain-containing protein [Thioalkalivibrio sp. ALE11]|uniref:DUF1826 domain-containing protein n=1 Tax=Thioalkalivibrio sp. ALE11 TaxID=1265494 RepID=UPI00036655CB|nr:DUF1826 domain-containing protein [Thioalkalivibrio sp. ALE11]
MSTRPRTRATAASRHRFIDRAAELHGIRRDDVNALIWRRPETEELRLQAQTLAEQSPGLKLELRGRPDQIRTGLLEAAGTRPFDIHHLALDIEHLARNFAVVTRRVILRAQLEVLEARPCPLFHVDQLELRMLCSYTGPGTEYVDDRHVDRSRLGSGDNDGVLTGHDPLRIARGHVILMKGERFPGGAGQAAVHRSPQPATGDPRLVLRLDA